MTRYADDLGDLTLEEAEIHPFIANTFTDGEWIFGITGKLLFLRVNADQEGVAS